MLNQSQNQPLKKLYLKEPNKVFGVGINDIKGVTSTKLYTTWHSMIRRCYSGVYRKRKPSDTLCYVCDNWLRLSSFKVWFDENYVEGLELDKDILVEDNRLYSSDTCCFIPKTLNSSLISSSSDDRLPTGVVYNKKLNKYIAQISLLSLGDVKCKHLLCSNSVDECHQEYLKHKGLLILELLEESKSIIKPEVYIRIRDKYT